MWVAGYFRSKACDYTHLLQPHSSAVKPPLIWIMFKTDKAHFFPKYIKRETIVEVLFLCNILKWNRQMLFFNLNSTRRYLPVEQYMLPLAQSLEITHQQPQLCSFFCNRNEVLSFIGLCLKMESQSKTGTWVIGFHILFFFSGWMLKF